MRQGGSGEPEALAFRLNGDNLADAIDMAEDEMAAELIAEICEGKIFP